MRPFRAFFAALPRLLADESFRAAFAMLVVLMAVGTAFYMIVEGWGLIDSLYFAVIAASTVGFGDYVPSTDLGKLFTIVYVLAGVGLLVMILGRIATGMVDVHLEERADTEPRRPRRSLRARRRDAGSSDESAVTTGDD